MGTSDNCTAIEDGLVKRFGPLIGGADLRNTLGYKSPSTFNRANRLNLIGVHIFEIPNRRGKFALTRDVAHWLANVSQTNH